jgi:hypothetical protein
LTISVAGFKKFIRQNLVLPVAQTLRIDAVLEVGSSAESVTVTEASPLLKTESGELSINVSTSTMNNLPVIGIGAANAGSAGIRNPYAVMNLLPGSEWSPDTNIRLNGLPSNTESMRIQGQDATNGLIDAQSMTEPSVEAIQEFAVETSNFAPEFGQVGGGYFNVTMRSGTNQFHGNAYEYFVNEALNAGTPFTNDGYGELLRPRQRRKDYGFTLGGPVEIPKVLQRPRQGFFLLQFRAISRDGDYRRIARRQTQYRPLRGFRRSDCELWAKMVGYFGRQRTVQLMMIMGDYSRVGFMLNAVGRHLPRGREALLPPWKR